MSNCIEMPSAVVKEFKWLDNVIDRLNQEISKDTLDVSWAAYHATQLSENRSLRLDVSLLMPLFQEEANSAAKKKVTEV